MEYCRITTIEDPLFKQMHDLMKKIFPPEEVLEFELWAEPLADPGIRVFTAVHAGEVVGATEYRYYEDLQVAMTDFTIIGQAGLGIGPFLVKQRSRDLSELIQKTGTGLLGMFAEIYNPYQAEQYEFGGIKVMDPYVRREVLSHLGYRRLAVQYVHPSWHNDGEAVSGLDLSFLSSDETLNSLPSDLIVQFLKRYYAVLPNKPEAWHEMISRIEEGGPIQLLPL